jgi:hypothetical protein
MSQLELELSGQPERSTLVPWEDEIRQDMEKRKDWRIIQGRINRDEAIARAWAVQIREAWLKRQPCPIIPEPAFKHVLEMAMLYSGI